MSTAFLVYVIAVFTIMSLSNSLSAVLAIASLPFVSATIFEKIQQLPKGWSYARNADPSE